MSVTLFQHHSHLFSRNAVIQNNASSVCKKLWKRKLEISLFITMFDCYRLRFPLFLLIFQKPFGFLFGFYSQYQYSPVSNVYGYIRDDVHWIWIFNDVFTSIFIFCCWIQFYYMCLYSRMGIDYTSLFMGLKCFGTKFTHNRFHLG